MTNALSLFVLFSLGAATVACNESRASTGDNASSSQAVTAAAPASAEPSQAKITKLVFIDKQQACDCTRARVTKGWDALQAALGGKPTPSVERLFMDTQPDQVRPYREMRPMMAVPALYFLNAGGTLVEQLQGEFSVQQIQAVLSSGR